MNFPETNPTYLHEYHRLVVIHNPHSAAANAVTKEVLNPLQNFRRTRPWTRDLDMSKDLTDIERLRYLTHQVNVVFFPNK